MTGHSLAVPKAWAWGPAGHQSLGLVTCSPFLGESKVLFVPRGVLLMDSDHTVLGRIE